MSGLLRFPNCSIRNTRGAAFEGRGYVRQVKTRILVMAPSRVLRLASTAFPEPVR